MIGSDSEYYPKPCVVGPSAQVRILSLYLRISHAKGETCYEDCPERYLI
jgi:hypothetical protein